MAEEIANNDIITTTSMITFGFHNQNAQEVIGEIDRYLLYNEHIHLTLNIYYDTGFKFDDTLEMRNKIFENKIHIKHFVIHNHCNIRDEHLLWFNLFVGFLQQPENHATGNNSNNNNGETTTKHFGYMNFASEYAGATLSLERANQLANAIRVNNNIESFKFYEHIASTKVFQPIWDVLLETGVQDVHLVLELLESVKFVDRNTIDFKGLSTNTSLNELHLSLSFMVQQNRKDFYNSIKTNRGLTNVDLYYQDHFLQDEEIELFKKMLRENITLLDFRPRSGLRENNTQILEQIGNLYAIIKIQMRFNRMWKRYIMKREEEASAAATATAAANNTVIVSTLEAERKKRFKMRLLLHAFIGKQVMRDTILFHLLYEYPDVLLPNDDVQQNQILRSL